MTDDVGSSTPNTDPPFVCVVKGSPTDVELAALVAVLAAATSAAGPASTPPPPSGWSAYRRSVRTPLVPGPDAWRSSGRPA